MSIESIAAVAAHAVTPNVAATTAALPSQGTGAPGVFDALVSQLQELNVRMETNMQAAQTLAVADADNLHRVMMEMERTQLLFDLTLQVRNKVLDAYQELMRMQV